MNTKILLAIAVLLISSLACGSQGGSQDVLDDLYASTPSVRPTLDLFPPPPTSVVVEKEVLVYETVTVIETVFATVEVDKEYTDRLCVTAENVYLRPTPSMENYPITALENGDELTDTQSRDGQWAFVYFNDLSGWVSLSWVETCGE